MADTTNSLTMNQLEIYLVDVYKNNKYPEILSPDLQKSVLSGEQDLSGSNVRYSNSPNSAGAMGLAQMKPDIASKLYKKTFGTEPDDASVKAALSDPQKSMALMKTYLEDETSAIKKQLSFCSPPPDIKDIRACISGSYNLGGSKNKDVIKASIVNGKFDRELYYNNYYNALAPGDRTQNNVERVRRGAGDLPAKFNYKDTAPKVQKFTVQKQRNAEIDYTPAISLIDREPYLETKLPSLIIDEGLDTLPWYQDPTLVNNRKSGLGVPAYFEINLKQNTRDYLRTKDDEIVRVVLNTSLSEVQESMAHIVNNRRTRTGFHITLWGQEPDTVSASGSTGLFMNWFGMTGLMSREGTIMNTDLMNAYLEAEKNDERFLAVLQENQPLRVAAQEAFMELLALFQNNGVTRFHPTITSRIFNKTASNGMVTGTSNAIAGDPPMNPWSKAIGASKTQATNRPNDVMTRGHVVFRFMNKSYLGYFKEFHFDMDANNPFRWNFSFTFQVERSMTKFFFFPVTGI